MPELKTAEMIPVAKRSIVQAMAERYGMEKDDFYQTMMETVMPAGCKPVHVAMLCVIAFELGLNPLKKEIYAFPAKNGGIQPIIAVDGWYTLANKQPMLDGMEFSWVDTPEGKPYSYTCVMHVKGRAYATPITEFLHECYRKTPAWDGMPRRMLRHRAIGQAVRVCFGLAGVMDEDEYGRMVEFEALRTTGQPPGLQPPRTLPELMERTRSAQEQAAAQVKAEAPPAEVTVEVAAAKEDARMETEIKKTFGATKTEVRALLNDLKAAGVSDSMIEHRISGKPIEMSGEWYGVLADDAKALKAGDAKIEDLFEVGP